jgi:SOS-response transcriptional repressor LexA
MAKQKIPPDPNLGKNLHLLMRRRGKGFFGLTQAQLASKAGIAQSSVGRILRGEVNPSAAAVARIADLLQVSIPDLYLPHEEFAKRFENPFALDLQDLNNLLDREGARQKLNMVPLVPWDRVDAAPLDSESVTWVICPVEMDRRGFALEVEGVSMFDPTAPVSFKEGERIFVEPVTSDQVRPGMFVVVKIGGGKPVLRQIVIEGASWYVMALNPTWPTRLVELSPTDTLYGAVRAKLQVTPWKSAAS